MSSLVARLSLDPPLASGLGCVRSIQSPLNKLPTILSKNACRKIILKSYNLKVFNLSLSTKFLPRPVNVPGWLKQQK